MLINEVDFKNAVPVGANFSFDRIKPDVRRVQLRFLRPILGKDLESTLSTKYEDNSLSEKQQELLDLVFPALAHLALWKYIPKGNVYLGDNGVQSVHTGNNKPAFEWQKGDLESSVRENGFDALEDLITHLEEVASDDFPEWLNSEGCTLVRSNFVNSAKAMTLHIAKMKNSRYLFQYLRPILTRVEKQRVLPVVGKPLFEALREEVSNGNLSEENKALMEFIEPAVCHGCWAEALVELALQVDFEGVHLLANTFSGTTRAKQPAESERIEKVVAKHDMVAKEQLHLLYDFLLQNVEDYPLFKDSDAYSDDTTTMDVENNKDWGIVSLGL